MSNKQDKLNGNSAIKEVNWMELISKRYGEENILMSPLLLEATLALLYLGSDGHTADELREILDLKRFKSNIEMANFYAMHLELISSEMDTVMQFCNKIIVDDSYQLGEEFPKIAYKYFRTDTKEMKLNDIEKFREFINASISYLTPGVDEKLLQSLLLSMNDNCIKALVLMVTNFKNKWFLPFSAYRSGLYDFHVNAIMQKSIPMLYDNDMFVKFGEFRELDARAIELPYEHEHELSMLLVLPNKRDGLASLLEHLYIHNLLNLAERMQMESVQVLLPKFRIEYECSWRKDLETLGIHSIFSKDANFNNLVNQECNSNFNINDILQKMIIEVNESGSDRSILEDNKPIVISNSIDTKQKFFRADHPFFFAIRNGNIVYLMGCVSSF